jgi:hypothetical protein
VGFDQYIKLGSVILGGINLLVSVGLWLYVRSSDRHEKIDQRFAAMEANFDERLDTTSERLTRLEERVQRSPTHADLGRIYERMNALAVGQAETKGAVDNLSAAMRQFMSRIIERGLS